MYQPNYQLTHNPDKVKILTELERVRIVYTRYWLETELDADGLIAVEKYAVGLLKRFLAGFYAVSEPETSQTYANEAQVLFREYHALFGVDIRTKFKQDLMTSLREVQDIFIEDEETGVSDYDRFINIALTDYQRLIPIFQKSSFVLIENTDTYPAPKDIYRLHHVDWGVEYNENLIHTPWLRISTIPKLRLENQRLKFNRNINKGDINQFGKICYFTYEVMPIFTTEKSNVKYLNILMVRAQAEAMKELGFRNVTKPIQLRSEIGIGTSNGFPTEMYLRLMQDFEKMAKNIK